jgi:hypothetical protein
MLNKTAEEGTHLPYRSIKGLSNLPKLHLFGAFASVISKRQLTIRWKPKQVPLIPGATSLAACLNGRHAYVGMSVDQTGAKNGGSPFMGFLKTPVALRMQLQ